LQKDSYLFLGTPSMPAFQARRRALFIWRFHHLPSCADDHIKHQPGLFVFLYLSVTNRLPISTN